MKFGNSLRAVAAAGLVLTTVGIGAGSASAAEKDGWLTNGEFGLFCYQNQTNSVLDLYASDSNFADDYFKGTQSCANQSANDWTESYSNRDTYAWKVHTDWKGGGYGTSIAAGARGNTNVTFTNSISSAYFF
uniref:Peptidase inhibitor family I36 n=1 Tax=Streptomyces sp. NBC_00049 TaxID=2903617 RepID=A0AAU2JR61_9ACTN